MGSRSQRALLINWVYDRTHGYCTYCGEKIHFVNHGELWRVGSWEMDHLVPRVRGGSDEPANLVPACVGCNRSKKGMTGWEFMYFLKSGRLHPTYLRWLRRRLG